MSIVDYFILVQNIILIALVAYPTLILCKGKKKAGGPGGGAGTPSGKGSPTADSLLVKSAIKPPITDPTPSMLGQVKEEPKKDGSKDDEKKKTSGESKAEGAGAGEKKEEEAKPADPKSKEPSLKPFPKFEMPTESKKKKKLAENEDDKKKKIGIGFYQEKSDEDDTLEKVDSLRVEQSDKTKRSQKKKK